MPDNPPRLDIRPVDPTDHAEMVAFQDIYEQAERAEFADASVFTLEDAVAVLTRTPRGRSYRGYAAFESGRMVGEGFVITSEVDNLRVAQLGVWVAPANRCRGVGTAVVRHLVDECRALGRDVLHMSARYPFERREDHPYRRFAEELGFTLANTEVERRLSLPVADQVLDDLVARSAPHHAGYLVRAIVGPIPTDLAPSYCEVINRLSVDAPGGDLLVEEGRRTPEEIADQDAEIAEQGRTRVSAVALDEAGSVVALTSSGASPPGYLGVDQWATIVRPEHRGHRLGMAVKVAQIQTIQESFPEKRYITTTNAETNAHMVAINEALGFERRALEGEFQLVLQPAGSAG